MTQEQIADFLGVSTPAVNKWEKGSKLAKTITDELANNEEYAFLRDGSEFEELIAELRD